MSAYLAKLLEDEDEDPPFQARESGIVDTGNCSTPPITGWLDCSLDMSPPGEVQSIIPFEPLSTAVNSYQLNQRLEEIEGQDDFNVAQKEPNPSVDRVKVNPIVREINRLIDRNFEDMNSSDITGEFYKLGSVYNSLKEL